MWAQLELLRTLRPCNVTAVLERLGPAPVSIPCLDAPWGKFGSCRYTGQDFLQLLCGNIQCSLPLEAAQFGRSDTPYNFIVPESNLGWILDGTFKLRLDVELEGGEQFTCIEFILGNKNSINTNLQYTFWSKRLRIGITSS